jgi:hypothetical protein
MSRLSLLYAVLSLSLLAGATGAFVEAPLRGAAARGARAPAATMIIDQMKAAAREVELAAAAAIVQQKVKEKLEKAQEKYDVPEKYLAIMGGFFTSYMTEVYRSGNDVDYYEKTLTALFKKVLERAKDPHKFEPFHRAMREPFDYYALGNEFAKPIINRQTSALVGLEKIDQMRAQMAAGDNVVLLANHQSEADPQVIGTDWARMTRDFHRVPCDPGLIASDCI